MATSNYYTVDNKIMGERNLGGLSLDYLPDALGTVTATSGGMLDSFTSYSPYGHDSTVSAAAFGWLGSLGYRSASLNEVTHYVRARQYYSTRCRWTSLDTFWPFEHGWLYVNCNPISQVDPSGQLSCQNPDCRNAWPDCDNPAQLKHCYDLMVGGHCQGFDAEGKPAEWVDCGSAKCKTPSTGSLKYQCA